MDFQKYVSGITLKEIQQSSCEQLYNSTGKLLALSCGLGKTVVVLCTCEAIRENYENSIFIIVIPKSARSVFIKEFENKFKVPFAIIGTNADKKYNYVDQPYILIESPIIHKKAQFIKDISKGKYVTLVVDEAHTALASPKTLIYQTLNDCYNCFDRKYLLTASPLLNTIDSLFFVYNFFTKKEPFTNYYSFREKFCILEKKQMRIKKYIRGKLQTIETSVLNVVGYKNLDQLKEPIMNNTILGSIKYDLIYDYIKFKLDDELSEEYKLATKGLVNTENAILDENGQKMHGSRLHDLQRIVDGATTDPIMYTSNKEKELLRLIKKITKNNEGAIIYCDYTDTIDRLKDLILLYKDKLDVNNVYVIDGSINTKNRIQIEDALCERDICIISQAGRVSINLQAVNHLIFFNIPFSQAGAEQAIGRICRCNSKYPKKYIHILECSGTIDSYKRILFQQLSNLVNKLFDDQHPTLPTDLMQAEDEARKDLKKKFLWTPNI